MSRRSTRLLAKAAAPYGLKPTLYGSQVKHTEEAFGELAETCCDGAVDLEMAKHALDATALWVPYHEEPPHGDVSNGDFALDELNH